MKLAQRAVSAPPFHAMSIGARAREIEARGHSVSKLSLGEPSFGAPPAVREALARAAGQDLPYTPAAGLPALREAIARFYRERYGVAVGPERVLVTAGASAGLLLATALTTEPGDDVVIADPCYPCNRELVASFGGRIVLAPTFPETRYQLDVEAMETAWTPYTNAVQMATPANPTGTSIPYDELGRLCEAARAQGAWRIVDEIYLGLSDPDARGRPARTVLAADPGAIVVSSFSKYFGMTGWRLGWLVLPEELVEPARNLAVNYFLCASTPAQLAALEAFTPASLALCEEHRGELVERRRLALGRLRALGLNVPVEPDGAFYIYFDVSDTGLSSWNFCIAVIILFTHPMLVWILRFRFFGEGHRWSGLDPEHLGARSHAAYRGGMLAGVATAGGSLARRRAEARRARERTEADPAPADETESAADVVEAEAPSGKEDEQA